MNDNLDETLPLSPAVMSLRALLPQGLDSLPAKVRRPLERDDYSAALKAANEFYADKGAEDRVAALTYAVLLVGRSLIDEAQGVLRRALSYHAQDVALQLVQIEALIVSGAFEPAVALLDALTRVSTIEPRQWRFMGDMHLDMGSEEAAIDCYELALDQGLDDADLAYQLGQIYTEREELDAAARHLHHAARLAPKSLRIWEAAADALFNIGEFEEAIYAYKRVLKRDPYNVRIWLYLAMAHGELSHFDEGVDALKEVTSLEPHHAFAWIQLGHMQMAVGHPGEALGNYRKALQLEPEDLDALGGAVGAAFELGDVQEAETLARKAVQIDLDHPESHYNLGVILLTLRRAKDAYEHLKIAAQAFPDDARFLASLALCEVMLDYRDDALVHIRQAAAEGAPTDLVATFVEELLKRRELDVALAFLEEKSLDDPTWHAVSPMLAFLGHGLKGETGEALGFMDGFVDVLQREPQVVPLMWDFDELERLSLGLNDELRKIFIMMVSVVEGRNDLNNLESMSRPS
ncbi:MAG: tetratricopeptide repeat protein [Bradymonadaceae bacterium]